MSSDKLIKKAKELHKYIEKAAEVLKEEKAILTVIAAIEDLTALIKEQIHNDDDVTYHTLQVSVQTKAVGGTQTTYLDTSTMKMRTNPPFFINDKASSNYSVVWAFHSLPSDGFFIRNYMNHGEIGSSTKPFLHLRYNPIKSWWTISFNSNNDEVSTIFIEKGDEGEFCALYAKETNKEGKMVTVYLLPVASFSPGEKSDEIVGVEKIDVKVPPHIWQKEDVIVTCKQPIKDQDTFLVCNL